MARESFGQGLKNTVMHQHFGPTLFGIGSASALGAIGWLGAGLLTGVGLGLAIGGASAYALYREEAPRGSDR